MVVINDKQIPNQVGNDDLFRFSEFWSTIRNIRKST